MNPRYSYSVKFYLEHGNAKPTLSEVVQLKDKVSSMADLVFGDKLMQSPDVLVIEDEEQELDYTVYSEVTVTLRCSLTVTADNSENGRHNAGCIAEGLLGDIDKLISINTDESGIEMAGATVDTVVILNVEVDQKDLEETDHSVAG